MSSELKYIHPTALAALNLAFKEANIRPVIVQTEGSAPESKGTHGHAGYYRTLLGRQQSYSGCVDISVNQLATIITTKRKVAFNDERIKWLLYNLAKQGFPGFYRRVEQGFSSKHMHIITPMVAIEGIPVTQTIDFLNDRNGLAKHGPETYWTANSDLDNVIAAKFARANPIAARGLPARFKGVLV